jgi:hypothetical protein
MGRLIGPPISQKIDDFLKTRRRHIRSSLSHYRKILRMLLDEDIDQHILRTTIFQAIDAETLKAEMEEVEDILGNNYSDRFKLVSSTGRPRKFTASSKRIHHLMTLI